MYESPMLVTRVRVIVQRGVDPHAKAQSWLLVVVERCQISMGVSIFTIEWVGNSAHLQLVAIRKRTVRDVDALVCGLCYY